MLAIFGFIYVADSKSGSESSPATTVTTIEDPNSVIEVRITSTLGDDVTAEHDEITLAGAGPLILDMDASNRDATDSFALNAALSGLEVDYAVKIVATFPDGTQEEFHGKGSIVVTENMSLVVAVDDNGVVTLE
ncbi:hypothetical protein ABZZ37_27125 [Streptomyces sp. NPDC006464]|uniref:hypothetical protein n=1 Tax=Streptomyces sp. NPDC006464 TaxID=3154305 RepID=UPI0033AFEEBF